MTAQDSAKGDASDPQRKEVGGCRSKSLLNLGSKAGMIRQEVGRSGWPLLRHIYRTLTGELTTLG